MMKTIAALFLLALTLATPAATRAEREGKIQILLLGDSTTEASIPRKLAPKEAQLEDVIRVLIAAEGDLPPTHVINLGLNGGSGGAATVEVLDNRLDAHFGNLEGWFGDRHPNLAGYRVIADETAKFLVPIIRQRSRK
jgi:lysophospholipase L1-like esterase